MEFLLFFLRKFSQLHALLEPPRLLISEKPATNTVFYVVNIEKIPTFPKNIEMLTIVAKSDFFKIPLTLSLEMIFFIYMC